MTGQKERADVFYLEARWLSCVLSLQIMSTPWQQPQWQREHLALLVSRERLFQTQRESPSKSEMTRAVPFCLNDHFSHFYVLQVKGLSCGGGGGDWA